MSEGVFIALMIINATLLLHSLRVSNLAKRIDALESELEKRKQREIVAMMGIRWQPKEYIQQLAGEDSDAN